jgi:hypothetical protein
MASSKGSTAELDSLICIRAERPARLDSYKPRGSFCKVLAVVEVKRNPDDIGEAFVGYQKSLAWLAGLQSLYDPSAWRTKAYPTGHFHERLFLQDWNGEGLIFTTESFAEMKRDIVRLPNTSSGLEQFVVSEESLPHTGTDGSAASTGGVSTLTRTVESARGVTDSTSPSRSYSMFVDGLYFVTKDGSLDSVHSKAMSWAINKVAGEKEFDMDLSDEEAVENLRLRVEERYPHRVSTLDVIDVYKQCGLYGQVFVVCDERWQNNINNSNNTTSTSQISSAGASK